MPFDEKYKFVNPYTFIPTDFSNENRKKEVSAEETKITGVLRCKLITKTPIAIPDPETKKTKDNHDSYSFMRKNDMLFIPGSSIRGVIRSVYETLTDSCFSTTDPTAEITYRNTGNGFKPGILKKVDENKYELYEAKRYIFKVNGNPITDKKGRKIDGKYTYKKFNKCEDIYIIDEDTMRKNFSYGDKVSFSSCIDEEGMESYNPPKGNGKQLIGYYIGSINQEGDDKEGFICIGEPFGNKHFESVFAFNEDPKPICISGEGNNLEEAVKSLENIVEMYNDKKLNKSLGVNKRVYADRTYKKMKKESCVPIWYKISKSKNKDGSQEFTYIDVSVAALGRSMYGKNIGQMLKKKKKCVSRENLCDACKLFGMVGKTDNGDNASLGSRLRFTDADIVSGKKVYTKNVTLKVLASPKPSYLPFYSKVNNNDNVLTRNKWSYNRDDVELRGRKYYWHNTKERVYEAPKLKQDKFEKTNSNATMELVGIDDNYDLKQAEFSFLVFFDAITSDELKKLEWTLTLGDNKLGSDKCHKIGHGKSIGLGSVKIVIDEIISREYSGEKYSLDKTRDVVEDVNEAKEKFDEVVIDNLLKVTSLSAHSETDVKYPFVVESENKRESNNGDKTAAHVWFAKNFKLGNNKPTYILPSIDGEDDSLCAWNNSFRENEVHYGNVTGHDTTGKFAYAKLENGGKASFYDNGQLEEGTEVKLKYKGKNEKGYD